jgi:DNA-binding NtrC family response regulator
VATKADVECAIKSDVNVLISGGDAAARTAVARLIHERSDLGRRLLVVVKGSRLMHRPQSEHTPPHPGGRTFFIEELAAFDAVAQDELMRLLDRPTESLATGTVETRIISATAHNLLGRVTSREFNAELFYRLNIVHIALGDSH